MTEKTCTERIGDHLAGRLEDLDKLTSGQPLEELERDETDDSAFAEDQAQEELDNYPLGVSVQRVIRVDLSTGGPADWLELFYNADNDDLLRAVYHFADWFDHADVTLEGDAFATVEAAFGNLIEYVQ